MSWLLGNDLLWLLRKDLLILRRSRLLIALLVVYPVAVALLIGFALSRAPLQVILKSPSRSLAKPKGLASSSVAVAWIR